MKNFTNTNPQGKGEEKHSMRRRVRVVLAIIFICVMSLPVGSIMAQGPRQNDVGSSPLKPGDAGISWYTTWDTAKEEAKRSNRPIFFFAAATKCNGVSGVF